MEVREFGEVVPISIGSAIAMEALGTETHPLPPKLWINVRTIVRNLMGAFPGDLPPYNDLVNSLMAEMITIREVVEALDNKCNIVWYFTSHKSIEIVFPRANIRYANTEKQREYNRTESKLTHLLANNTKEIRQFDVKLSGRGADAYILTHHSVDLLSRGTFGKLKLLESHTGALKPQSEWYTKLLNGYNLVGIPFNALTLQVYGDKARFRPQTRAVKKILTETAIKCDWTSVSTTEKVMYGLDRVNDIITKKLFKEMLFPKLR